MDIKTMDDQTKILKLKELEEICGGNIFDDIDCFFSGHGYNIVGTALRVQNDFKIVKYRCVTCGKEKYEKVYKDDTTESASKGDYEMYAGT